MKLTLSPTDDQTGEEIQHNTVTIESPDDIVTYKRLIKMFLASSVAWGFSEQGLTQAMKEYEQ